MNTSLLPPLLREHFPNVRHWNRGIFSERRKGATKTEDSHEGELPDLEDEEDDEDEEASTSGKKSKPKKNQDPALSCFLEDKDGNPLSGEDKTAISAKAHTFWQYLVDNNRAPKSFRKANLEVLTQYRNIMESSFECLRYCHNHWKVDQIWKNYYPSWIGIHKEKPKKAANAAVIDVDVEHHDQANDQDIEEGGAEVVEDASKSKTNKRPAPDSGETTNSKRPRVESANPPPAAAKTKGKVSKVRKPFSMATPITENV